MISHGNSPEMASTRASAASLSESEDHSEGEDYLSMSDELSGYIYEHRIAPENLVKEGVRGRPQFWIVAGENGIGKTTGMEMMGAKLQGPTQKISADDLVKYVEGYHDLAAKDPALAQEEGGDFTNEWCDRLRDDAGKKGAHILIECSLPEAMQEDIEFAEKRGYETGLYLIAEPKEISWTAVVDRADKALKSGHIGTSAVVSAGGHSRRYAAWPRAVFDAERDVQFDQIIIARRDGTVMYHNLREERDGAKRWANRPQGLDVLLLERHRGLGPAQVDWLDRTWEVLANSSRLKADRFMRSIPLHRHKVNILNRANSGGNRFDPFDYEAARDPQGRVEWRNHLIRDLELIKTSRNTMGPSAQFDLHLDRYAAALIDYAYRPELDDSPIPRLGQPSPLPAKPDRKLAVLGSPSPAPRSKRTFEATEQAVLPSDGVIEGDTHEGKRPKLDERSRADRVR